MAKKTKKTGGGNLGNFNYEESLDRVMTLPSVIFFGLAYLAPCTIFGTYGIVCGMTHGMLALSYAVATIAMLFTALSYRQMVRAYPIAGSVYAYVQRTINPYVGFMSGWAILLDYILLPMFNFVSIGLYLPMFIPQIPGKVWIFIFVVLVTVVNLVGMKVTTLFNNVLIFIQVIFLAAVLFFSLKYILGGGGAGTLFSADTFFNSTEYIKPEVGWSAIFGGASILAMSFLGFDSVTTIAEEAIEPEKNIGKALIIICLAAGGMFILTSYIMQLAWPEAWSSFKDPDTGVMEYYVHVIGNFIASCSIAIVAVSATASAIASQASAARILFGMGRDGVLPKKIFGFVSKKTKIPALNVIIIGVISLSSLVLDLSAAASLVNFGALLGFVMVNLSVIAHYYIKQKNRGLKASLEYLVLPLIGAVICGTIWFSLDSLSKILGGIWLIIGFVFIAISTKFFTQKPPELDMSE